jgi:hypothetical protein
MIPASRINCRCRCGNRRPPARDKASSSRAEGPSSSTTSACAARATLASAVNAQVLTGQNFNVNPGTADKFVGDPYLQRQVEPKMVCASNNPQLCVAIANDYRTVDMTADQSTGFGEAKLRDLFAPKSRLAAAPDAWPGLYRTPNGGADWMNGLVPGSPLDNSPLGASAGFSPLPL